MNPGFKSDALMSLDSFTGRIPAHPVIRRIRGEVVCPARAAAVVSVTHQTGTFLLKCL